MKTYSRLVAAGAAGLMAAAAMAPAATARPADAPDTACMQAGIATLQGAGLLSAVAKDGLPVSLALTLAEPRPGADLSGLPDPLPLSLVLADHRAGHDSLLIYPWCDNG